MEVHAPRLSLREIEVLRLAAEGFTAKSTAQVLHLSESAVNLYLMHARQKLNARTKVEAIAMLMDSGMVLRDSIEHVNKSAGKAAAGQDEKLKEMLQLSNKMRHLLEDMLIADAARKSHHSELAIWNELAEKLLKMAAQACGYEIVKESSGASQTGTSPSTSRKTSLVAG